MSRMMTSEVFICFVIVIYYMKGGIKLIEFYYFYFA